MAHPMQHYGERRKPTRPLGLYLIDWVAFEEKYPKAFSLAAQCDDVIVPIEGEAFYLILESEMGERESCLYIPSTDGCSDEGLYAVSIGEET